MRRGRPSPSWLLAEVRLEFMSLPQTAPIADSALADRQPLALLRASGVVRRYGQRAVIDGLDLHVDRGEILVLLGENGAGKTTLMRTLAGELAAHGGTIEIDGCPLHRDPETARRALIYVAQHPSLAPLASLREHATALAGFRNLEHTATATALQALATDLRLANALDLPIRALSGGMQHKAALILAFLAQTPLMMLDEPHTGLDVRSALALRALILQRKAGGTAFILASHMAEASLALADRALVLRGGKVGRAFSLVELQGFGGDARAFELAVLGAM